MKDKRTFINRIYRKKDIKGDLGAGGSGGREGHRGLHRVRFRALHRGPDGPQVPDPDEQGEWKVALYRSARALNRASGARGRPRPLPV